MRYIIFVLVLFAISAGCVCFAQELPNIQAGAVKSTYRWERKFEHEDWLYRTDCTNGQCRREILVGAWSYSECCFVLWENGVWGKRIETAPIDPPGRVNKQEQQPTGVELDKLHQGAEKYEVSGLPVSKGAAFEAVAGAVAANGELKDDSELVRVTVIAADEAKRKALIRHIFTAEEFKPFKDSIHVWGAPPTHFSLEAGFKKDVDGIYVQDKAGLVLHRQEGLETGKLLDALRKIDPKYKPENDNDLSRLLSLIGFNLDSMSQYLWIGLAAIAGLILGKNSGPEKGS